MALAAAMDAAVAALRPAAAPHSMSITLDSFCRRFSSRSPCLMACWYKAFLASGLRGGGGGVGGGSISTHRKGGWGMAAERKGSICGL